MSEVFVNKVANSGLITLDLEAYLPTSRNSNFRFKGLFVHGFDIKRKRLSRSIKKSGLGTFRK